MFEKCKKLVAVHCLSYFIWFLVHTFTASAQSPSKAAQTVLQTPGLVAFWTFGEEAGRPRLSIGTREKHPLQEVGGPIARAAGGPYSGYSAVLNGKQYFRIPYAETGNLNISGQNAQVTLFAVMRIFDLKRSRTIAGMWSEGKGADDDTGTRQYALLMNMPTYGGPNKLVPHISSEGGVTRRADGSAFPWCADYAATASEVPTETWCTLGFTYDAKYIRAYINGVLDELQLDPVKHRREDRYFTQEGPGGKDRGMNPYYHGRGIFRFDPALHALTKPGGGSDFTVGARYAVGSMLGEATKGHFGALAVFNRALTDTEMKALHGSAKVEDLNSPAASRVDGYRGIWSTLGQFFKHGDKYSGGLGTYTANQTPKTAIGIKVDKAQLRAAADRYLNACAVYAALLAVSKFNFNDLAIFWRNVVSLVNAVIAAVELAKSGFEGVPGTMAAFVAVDILDDAITFTGPVGRLVKLVDAPFLK